jgi:uncharacterized protein YraI
MSEPVCRFPANHDIVAAMERLPLLIIVPTIANNDGESKVKIRIVAGAALALAMLGATAAQAAAPGYTTANVNIRTGPDTEFPSVGVIREGDDIFVEGCLRDESWCDVRWDGNRGWVYSEYIAFKQRGETVLLPDVGLSVFNIPTITFTANDYWRRHYTGRPWYKDRDRWVAFKPRPRKGWRAPPPGPRKHGWWRSGYRAPEGMRAPPERGWKRPERSEDRRGRMDERRGEHRDRPNDRPHDKQDGNRDRR